MCISLFWKSRLTPVQIKGSNHPPMANTLFFVFLYFLEQFSCRSGLHQAIFFVLPVIRLSRWCLQSRHCVHSTLHLHRIFILHVCHCVILRYRCCVWQKRVWATTEFESLLELIWSLKICFTDLSLKTCYLQQKVWIGRQKALWLTYVTQNNTCEC